MLNELYYIDYYILVFIYVRLQTHDRQAVEPPSGGVRLAVRFFSPKIEALFEGNRASV